jgi:spore coat assembly protein SafA
MFSDPKCQMCRCCPIRPWCPVCPIPPMPPVEPHPPMPPVEPYPPEPPYQPPMPDYMPPCPGGCIYTAVAGDTLFLIAQRFGVSLDALIAANPQITDPNVIQVGQRICIPPPTPAPVPPCPGGFIYTVVPGDTMFLIAQRFGVSLQALIAANPQIPDPNVIQVGERICIPPREEIPCPGGTIYTVVAGDTLFFIAQRFGVSLQALIAANPQISDPNVIQVGQRICIPPRRDCKKPKQSMEDDE